MGSKPLKSISCDPVCGFMVKSHDEDEVVNLAFEHTSNKHKDMKVTREQLVSMVKSS